MDQPRIVILSCILYRGLLHCGPTAFWHEYQRDLLSDFRQQCLAAYRQQGRFGVLSLWPTHLTLTFRDLSYEHLSVIWQVIIKWHKIITALSSELKQPKNTQKEPLITFEFKQYKETQRGAEIALEGFRKEFLNSLKRDLKERGIDSPENMDLIIIDEAHCFNLDGTVQKHLTQE